MRIKLTKTICDNAKPNNKRQFLNDSEHIGLNFVIGARRSDNTCSKSWYYTYRPKGQNPTKIYLAPYPSYSVAAARLKAKQVQRDILDKKDPFLIKQSLKQELTLRELIGEFYKLQINQYKPKTIEAIKSCFKVWIFHQINKPGYRQYFTYSIKDKKISNVTPKDIINLHKAISVKTGYSANRTVEYLRCVYNWAISEQLTKNQPVQFTKRKGVKNKGVWFREKENNETLTKEERECLISLCFVKDKKTDLIDFQYYIKNKLNMISCLAIAWCLLTGRRQKSEGLSIRFNQIDLGSKKIKFEDTKTGFAEYNLSPRAVDLISTILKSKDAKIVYPKKYYQPKRVPERISPTPWTVNQSDYVFPSLSNFNEHIGEARGTWKKLLKIAGIKYLPLKQCRHTFGTLLLSSSKSLTAVQGALGHSNARTTERYAKILNEDVVTALNNFDNEQIDEAQILNFKS